MVGLPPRSESIEAFLRAKRRSPAVVANKSKFSTAGEYVPRNNIRAVPDPLKALWDHLLNNTEERFGWGARKAST